MTWVHGWIALLSDSAHAPLQYIARGAVMRSDGRVLGEHVASSRTAPALSTGTPPLLPPTRRSGPSTAGRVVTTSRPWGERRHLDGVAREQCNVLLRARNTCDYPFLDWLYGPTALLPDDEPALFAPIPLSSVETAGV